MRVSPVSLNSVSRNHINKKNNYSNNKLYQPQFQGKMGVRIGAVAGGITAIVLAVLVAPVLVCAGPILAVLGGYSASEAEDKIKRNKLKNKP